MAKTTETKAAKPKAKASAKSSAKPRPPGRKAKQAVAGPPRQPGVERRKNHPLRAKNGHISLLLTHAVPHVGQPGELVKVRPGFARNFLLPQGKATFATPHNLRIVEKHRSASKSLRKHAGPTSRTWPPRSPSGRSPSRPTPTRKAICTARSTPTRLPRPSSPKVSRSRPRTSGSRARSRTWACTRSRFSSARRSAPTSSSGSSRPTPKSRLT